MVGRGWEGGGVVCFSHCSTGENPHPSPFPTRGKGTRPIDSLFSGPRLNTLGIRQYRAEIEVVRKDDVVVGGGKSQNVRIGRVRRPDRAPMDRVRSEERRVGKEC